MSEALEDKLSGCTEQVLGFLADFHNELVKHLNELTKLNSQIAVRNANLAINCDFEKDICQICNYYDRIIFSTKTLVDYGSD